MTDLACPCKTRSRRHLTNAMAAGLASWWNRWAASHRVWQDVQQVKNVDGLCIAREVFVAVGLQRDLAVAQVNQRLARPTAEGDVIAQMLEDFCLAADLDQTHAATLDRTHLDRARQAGPVPFRRGEARAVLVAKQRLHEFLRRAHMPVQRVHRANAGHLLLLVLFLPLGEVRPRRRWDGPSALPCCPR